MTETRDFFSDVMGVLVVAPSGCSVSDVTPRSSGSEFQGTTYVPTYDKPRLNAQQARVLSFMQDGQFHTLREISEATGDPEASVSARLRDFRKIQGGMFTVKRQRRGNPKLGVWEYSVSSPVFQR